MIPSRPAGTPIDMVADYGSVTLQQIQVHAVTFANNRNMQNSQLLMDILFNSLSQMGLQHAHLWRYDYTANGIPSGAVSSKWLCVKAIWIPIQPYPPFA